MLLCVVSVVCVPFLFCCAVPPKHNQTGPTRVRARYLRFYVRSKFRTFTRPGWPDVHSNVTVGSLRDPECVVCNGVTILDMFFGCARLVLVRASPVLRGQAAGDSCVGRARFVRAHAPVLPYGGIFRPAASRRMPQCPKRLCCSRCCGARTSS